MGTLPYLHNTFQGKMMPHAAKCSLYAVMYTSNIKADTCKDLWIK